MVFMKDYALNNFMMQRYKGFVKYASIMFI